MPLPEKSPAKKSGESARSGATASAARRSAMTPAIAAGGPMTPAAVLTLQRAVGNHAVARALAQEEHAHGAGCGHGTVQREAAAEAPVEILNAAMSSASRPIESSTLKKAQSFYQNDRLSQGRVHTGPLAQRAVAAFGAKAMTVGTHIFFGAGVERDPATAGHEYGHLDKNTRGIAETGTDKGTGAPVTDPGQHSERQAATDGAAFAQGADVAPSVVTQRAVRQGGDTAVVNGGAPAQGQAVQRMEEDPRGRRSPNYEADASASDSSPERRALREHIEQEVGDLGDLSRRAEGLGHPGFRRVRAVHHDSESSEESPERAPAAPHRVAAPSPERLPDLPENDKLTPLRELLMRELHTGGLDAEMKVTIRVNGGDRNPAVHMGHSWIEFTGSGGETTVGFFPTDRNQIALVTNVPGGVHCPDPVAGKGNDTHHESKKVPVRRIVDGYLLIHAKSGSDYNFTLNNCTTFAGEAWKTITGKTLPREWLTLYGALGAVVSTPHGTAEGLEGHQRRRYEARQERVRSHLSGRIRDVIPGGAAPEEIAERIAREKYSQSSSSPSSEEVD